MGLSSSDEFALVIMEPSCVGRGGIRKHFGGTRPNVNEAIAWVLDPHGQFGEALDVQQIAQRWRDLRQFAAALLSEHDHGATGGADSGIVGHGWLADRGYDGSFGYNASTGKMRPLGNLQAFQGLNEGFHQL